MNATVRAPAAFPATSPRSLHGRLIVVALAAASLAGAAAASDAPPTVRVAYGDLNLGSDAGRDALLHRLSAAAHRLCDDPGTLELQRVIRADACYRETLDNAVVAVHNERLSTLYRARTGSGAI